MGLFKKKQEVVKKEEEVKNDIKAGISEIELGDNGKAKQNIDPNVDAISKLVNQKAAVHYEELSILVVILQKLEYIEHVLKTELEKED